MKLAGIVALSIFFLSADLIYAITSVVQSKDVSIFYEDSLKNMAYQVAEVYPSVRDELVHTLGQEADFRPEVVLIKERDKFNKISGSDSIIAFALPDRNLMVLDASRVYTKPFTLEATLKHELCHLVLHRGADGKHIPRWFDEGVCQWSSGGIAELMSDEGDKVLTKAVMSQRLIGLRELERFPQDGKLLILAYEESKSVVEFIVSEYGKGTLLRMIENLKMGDSMDESLSKSPLSSLEDLEKNWLIYLRKQHTWFLFLSNNLYIILFTLAALMTFYGFVRLIRRKRAYVDEEEEEEGKE